MEYKIKVFSTLCHIEEFVINGIDADEDDFVNKYDHTPDEAEYSCGDMQADIIPPAAMVLIKYKINEDEYAEIAAKVANELSFGKCGWCV